MLFRIAEITNIKTLTGRTLIEIAARFRTGIPRMPGFHYKSIVYLSVKNSISYTNSVYMSKYEIDTEYSWIQIRHLSNSFHVCGITKYLVIQSTACLQFFYAEFWKINKKRSGNDSWGQKFYLAAAQLSQHKSNNKLNQYTPLQLSWGGDNNVSTITSLWKHWRILWLYRTILCINRWESAKHKSFGHYSLLRRQLFQLK